MSMSQLLGRICKMSMAKWQVYLSARPKGGQYHASSNSKPCWERFQTPNLPRYHGYDQCIPAWKWFVSISLTPFEARRHVKSKREQAGDFHIFTSSTLLQNLHSAICKREALGISKLNKYYLSAKQSPGLVLRTRCPLRSAQLLLNLPLYVYPRQYILFESEVQNTTKTGNMEEKTFWKMEWNAHTELWRA